MRIGDVLKQFLTKLEWFSTLFPRIPVPIQKELEQRLAEKFPNAGNSKPPIALNSAGRQGRHIPDDEVQWGEAERRWRGRCVSVV